MLGIALEGGGVKGAYHIGAIKACMEMGYYPPQAIAGASIGAMNAAMIAQGDFEQAEELWKNVSGSDVFSKQDEKLINANFRKLDVGEIADLLSTARAIIAAGGVDNTNMKGFIDRYVDPHKLMESPIDFGIVTFARPEFKAFEIFKDEMGEENIKTYILASAAFPGFKRVKLGQSTFVDGGVYDNCPVNMLLERGCNTVIAVRTNAVGVTRYDDKDPRVITVWPSEDLGSLMKFSPKVSRHNMELGYYDGLRALMKLGGRRYYLTDDDTGICVDRLFMLPDSAILESARLMKIPEKMDPRRLLMTRLLPVLFEHLGLDRYAGYHDLIIAMIEDRAERCGIKRLSLYTAKELMAAALEAQPSGRVKNINKAIDLILMSIAGK